MFLLPFQALPMLDEATLNCVNHSFGCKYKDKGKKLQAHLTTCVHEQVRKVQYPLKREIFVSR